MTREFKRYNSLGEEEALAAAAVVRSGCLSKYVGEWGPDFYGGPEVQSFEQAWREYFAVEHAIAVNSWTSGLIAALGSIKLVPGDEVILPPWTMSACAAAILHWNAIPVFADIDPNTYCIDPASCEALVSDRTRAIMAVDIFGHPADMKALRLIAERHGVVLLSDTAQAPGAYIGDALCGTQGDIGGFSLNYHKHIHTGEGGMIVTNDDSLAERARMIRNHAEAVVAKRPNFSLENMIGYNFRLGEIEAAIGKLQLRKLASQVESRQLIAEQLTEGLSGLAGLCTPFVKPGNTHAYYVYALQVDPDVVGSKSALVERLTLAGVPGLSETYANLHLLPMFQERTAYGSSGFPWTAPFSKPVDYRKGICPVAEDLQDRVYIGFSICEYDLSTSDVEFIVDRFHSVWSEIL